MVLDPGSTLPPDVGPQARLTPTTCGVASSSPSASDKLLYCWGDSITSSFLAALPARPCILNNPGTAPRSKAIAVFQQHSSHVMKPLGHGFLAEKAMLSGCRFSDLRVPHWNCDSPRLNPYDPASLTLFLPLTHTHSLSLSCSLSGQREKGPSHTQLCSCGGVCV